MTITTGEADTSTNSFLIEKDGDRQWVRSIEGFVGWTILKQGPGSKPPGDHCDFVDGQWIERPARRTAAERRARFQAMGREELVDFLLDLIKKGDARLDALSARVDALEAPPPEPPA